MNDSYAPDFDVRLQGLTLAADVRHQVLDLEYDNHLDTADMFRVRIADPGVRIADSALFDVGTSVEIHMGYAGRLEPMMLGEIAEVESSFSSEGSPILMISGYDRSQPLRHGYSYREFKAVNDSLIAALVAAEHLLIPVVDPSPLKPRDTVSHVGSDWALLNELADRNFFRVSVNWDQLRFQFPRPQTERAVLDWGSTLTMFAPRIGGGTEPGSVAVRGYDEMTAEAIVMLVPALAAGNFDNLIERGGRAVRDLVLKRAKEVVFDQPVDNFFDAAVLAKSLLQRLLEGIVEGSGTAVGNPKLRAGEQVEIRGVGQRFSGTYTLRQVRHVIGQGGYETHFEISQKYGINLLEHLREKISDRPSPKHSGKPRGLVVGEVVNNVDPDGLNRVMLRFPEFSDVNLSAWARVAAPMAGKNSGFVFVPDVGDEVLVAFEHDNFAKPIVLGGLWNGRKRPPTTNSSPLNNARLIQSRSGMKIQFDDSIEGGPLVISHPGGGKVTLDSDGSVTVEAASSLKLKGASVSIDAGAGDVTISANNVNVKIAGAMDVTAPS